MKLSKAFMAGLRHSLLSSTVYENGGYDYRLYPESEDRDARELSRACLRNGMPEVGYVAADGTVYDEAGKVHKARVRESAKPISTRTPRVAVEYDCRGSRKQREFDDAFEARRFYTAKDKAGRNPVVRRVD
jgi:hypothetical protein